MSFSSRSVHICPTGPRVVLGCNSSFVVHLLCSVPQGSVSGPRMFIMYTADLADFVAERQEIWWSVNSKDAF